MNPASRRARASLILILAAGTMGWILFVAGTYFDTALLAERQTDDRYGEFGEDTVALVYPSKYLIFAAIAFLATATLIAKRRLVRDEASSTRGTFHSSVVFFSNVVLVVSLGLAAFAGLAVFMGGFFDESTRAEPVIRAFDVYVPIVLHTVLLVSVILAGFVFLRQAPTTESPANPPSPTAQSSQTTQSEVSSIDPRATTDTRSLAFAYAVPILAAAVALLLGLLVYDITQTALEVWIWVIIAAIVATGIITGTWFARRAAVINPSGHEPDSHNTGATTGATTGAINLNFILSIVFAVVVAAMALGYGSAATAQLRADTYASINVFDDEWQAVDTAAGAPLDTLSVQADAGGLMRNSSAMITLEPGALTLVEETADRYGYLYLERPLDETLSPGDYSVTLSFTTARGDASEVRLDFTVTDERLALFPHGSQQSFDGGSVQLLPVTLAWFMGDLLPAFLLWALTMLVIYFTLAERNRYPRAVRL